VIVCWLSHTYCELPQSVLSVALGPDPQGTQVILAFHPDLLNVASEVKRTVTQPLGSEEVIIGGNAEPHPDQIAGLFWVGPLPTVK